MTRPVRHNKLGSTTYLDVETALLVEDTSEPSGMNQDRETLLEYLRKKLVWIFLAIAVLSACFIAIALETPPLYTSTTSIFVQPKNTNVGEASIFPEPSADLLWVLSELNSTNLQNHLNERFDLRSHYGIGPNHPNGDLICYTFMNARIQARRINEFTVNIIVHDPDPLVASEIANAAAEYLIQRRLTNFRDRQKLLIASYEKLIALDQVNFDTQLEALSAVLSKAKGLRSEVELNDLEIQLTGIMNRVESANAELIGALKLQEISKTLKDNEIAPGIRQVRTAIPDITTKPDLIIVLRILVAVLIAMTLVFGAFIFWRVRRAQFKQGLASLNRL